MDNCVNCHERPIHIKKSSLCKKCYMDAWTANRKKIALELNLPQATTWKNAIEEINTHIKYLKFQLKLAEVTKIKFVEVAENILKD